VFNLQGSEIVVILLLALVVLGPEKLPDAVRKFTQTYAELKKMSSGFQSELKSALDEPMREMRETAGLVRNAADPSKLIAEMEAEERLLEAGDVAAATTDATEPIDPPPSDGATTDRDA
jgi:sec-independent protein translocase protein TatB